MLIYTYEEKMRFSKSKTHCVVMGFQVTPGKALVLSFSPHTHSLQHPQG